MISADSSSQSGRSNSSRKCTRSRAADVVARHLRPQVADRLVRHAHVGADHPDERLVRLAAPHQVHDRDPDALLVDLVRAAAVDAAADVGRVAAGGEEGDHAAAVEDRRHDRHVVDLAGRLPGVVGDQHVARLERVGRVGVHEVAHAGGHRVDVAGRAGERLGHHVRVAVEHAAGEVLRLAHDRREGGAHQRHLLLVDDRQQPVPEHLEAQDVHHATVTTRFQRSSTDGAAAGADDERRLALLDDRRALDAGAGREPVAVVDGGRARGRRARDARPGARPCARRRPRPPRPASTVGPRAGRLHAPGDRSRAARPPGRGGRTAARTRPRTRRGRAAASRPSRPRRRGSRGPGRA